MTSIGEARWRLLRKFLKAANHEGTFGEMRTYCRYDKDVEFFHELVRMGLLQELKSHVSKRPTEQGKWRLTLAGIEAADMGEVTLETLRKLKKPPQSKKKRGKSVAV